MFKLRKNAVALLVLAAFFILDRLLKFYFIKIKINHFVSPINWLQFRLVINQGISFGLKMPQFFIFFIYVFSFFILTGLIIFYWKKNIVTGWFLSSLMLLGAFSNFIDRLKFGGVIDYIDVSFFTIFNLSDVLICCSVICLIFIYGIDKNFG